MEDLEDPEPAELKAKFSTELSRLGLLEGLSQEQCAALLTAVVEGLGIAAGRDHLARLNRHRRDWEVWRKKSPPQIRRIKRKIKEAGDALLDARRYAAGVGDGRGKNPLLKIALLPLLSDFARALRMLQRLDAKLDFARAEAEPELEAMTGRTRPGDSGSDERCGDLAAVYRRAGLPPSEIEVRIARIANNFWGEKVEFVTRTRDASRVKGSPTIRQRLRRDEKNRKAFEEFEGAETLKTFTGNLDP